MSVETEFIVQMSVWGTYFGVGTLLLILLVWSRAILRKRAKKQDEVDRTMYRHRASKAAYGTRRKI